MKRIFGIFVSLYQVFLSRSVRLLFGPGCRFTPSCSEYAKKAVEIHGIFYGTLLTVKRLLKCHPWGSFGLDEVPKI